MNHEIYVTDAYPDWLENIHQRLQKPLARSERLKLTLLCILNITGTLLVLLPAILCVATSVTALYFVQQLVGPLDWFLFELLGGSALLCGIVAVDLLFTRPDFDDGVAVTKAQAPGMFAMLEKQISGFRLPKTDQIRVNDGSGLHIDASPRWLLPFGHRCRLHIGAALLFFLEPEQFRMALAAAVAAHATTHRSMRGSLAQSRHDWKIIYTALHRRKSISSGILRRPVGWIAALIVLLGNELEDHDRKMQYRWLRENTAPDTAADLLAARTITTEFLARRYWPMVFRAADSCSQPVTRPFVHFELMLQRTLQSGDIRRWLLEAQPELATDCELPVEPDAGHPTWTGAPAENAFSVLFETPDILEQLDQYWRKKIEPDWHQRHQQAQVKRQHFNRLHKLAGQLALRGRVAMRYIKLAEEMLDNDQAIEAWQSTFAANFDDATIALSCGQFLLAANATEMGRRALSRAVELDPSLAERHAFNSGSSRK